VLRISTALAVALTAWAMVVATGSSATAINGDAVRAGQTTTATNETVVENTNVSVSCSPFMEDGLVGCGGVGVVGFGIAGVSGIGSTTGVAGNGDTYGLYAATSTGTGAMPPATPEKVWWARAAPTTGCTA